MQQTFATVAHDIYVYGSSLYYKITMKISCYAKNDKFFRFLCFSIMHLLLIHISMNTSVNRKHCGKSIFYKLFFIKITIRNLSKEIFLFQTFRAKQYNMIVLNSRQSMYRMTRILQRMIQFGDSTFLFCTWFYAKPEKYAKNS